LGIRLLGDLKTVFGDTDQMTTEAVLRALHGMAEAPWNDLKGKQLNERSLAQRLRQYGIKSRNIRIGSNPQDIRKGYTRESFYDAWQAYLTPPPPDTSATPATDATSDENPSHFNGEDVADTDQDKRYSPHTSATDHTDVADSASDVADDVADKCATNGSKNSGVTDVADVALVPEAEGDDSLEIPACLDRRGEVCAHCGRPGAEPWDWDDGRKVLLHARCATAWADAQRNQRSRVVTGSSLTGAGAPARAQPAGIGRSIGPPLAPDDDLTIPTFLQRGHADCVVGSSLRSEEEQSNE
jgi:hypothetical protein